MNQKLADIFDDMAREFRKDRYRKRAYETAADAIRRHDKIITSGTQARKEIKGIGKSISDKIDEVLATGKLQVLEVRPEEIKRKEQVIKLFEGIYGVGSVTAEKWYDLGYRTLEDLRNVYDTMTDAQKLGYYYYYQLKERIPRAEMDIISNILSELWKGNEFVITGSYRRGEASSGDIDIVIKDGPLSINHFVNILIQNNLIMGNLALGPTKYMGIFKLKDSIARRIDIRLVNNEAWPYALLYFTGSKQLMIEMRSKAQAMGLTMNEYSLTNSQGMTYPAKTEKDIFDYLGMKYLEPNQRSVMLKQSPEIKIETKGKWSRPSPTLLLYVSEGIVSTGNIAAFDLDWTLVRPVRGQFPRDANDIALLPNRLSVLKEATVKGYTIVIFTNQKSTTEKKLQLNFARVNNCVNLLDGIKIIVLMSTGEDIYRKPNTGMWQILQKMLPPITSSFYVGDASGRPGDFSDSDKMFAQNIGIPFYTPEQIFPSVERLKPLPTIAVANIEFPPGKNMVLFVGMPGSGKTNFYETTLKGLGYVHINQDTLGTKAKVMSVFKKSLIASLNIVIDATNPSQNNRQEFYDLATQYGYNIIVIYFVRDGKEYNKLRPKPVPTIAYNMYFKNLVEPTPENTPGSLYQIS